MKKEYKKPEIFVEEFNIAQNIAAGCSVTQGANQYGGSCPFVRVNGGEFEDEPAVTEYLFTTGLGTCVSKVDHLDCQDGPNEYGGYFYS